MPQLEFPRTGLREIDEVEPALKAAVASVYVGMSLTPRAAIIHLAESASAEHQLAAAQAYQAALAALDPGQPPPGVRRAQRQQTARAGISAADFAALQAANNAASSIPALRQQVALLTRLVYQLAAASALTDAADPGG